VAAYRVYKLNAGGHIVAGEWIEAEDDAAAVAAAHAFCDAATPAVELWRAAVQVAVLHCG
jgi:hypothetical protein